MRSILVSMPRTGQTSRNISTFGEGTILMLTDTRHSGDLIAFIAKDGNPFSPNGDAQRNVFDQFVYATNRNKTILPG